MKRLASQSPHRSHRPGAAAPRAPVAGRVAWAARFCCLIIFLSPMGCDDMSNDSRLNPMENLPFRNGSASQHPPPNTVARSTPISTAIPVGDTYPFPITAATLQRGQQRYNIFCSVCHGALGEGDGMIVRRGFVRPPSFHEPRLRNAPASYYIDVITNGYGAMYSYSDRIDMNDRYAITAYIRALQLSQNADLKLLSQHERDAIERGAPAQ